MSRLLQCGGAGLYIWLVYVEDVLIGYIWLMGTFEEEVCEINAEIKCIGMSCEIIHGEKLICKLYFFS